MAQRIHCVNNLKQMHLAVMGYAADHENSLVPFEAHWTDPKWRKFEDVRYRLGIRWHHILWDGYLGQDTNVFHCAANTRLPEAVRRAR